MAGATAAVATSAAHADQVTITLSGELLIYGQSGGGNGLHTDFNNNQHPDITLSHIYYSFTNSAHSIRLLVAAKIDGQQVDAFFNSNSNGVTSHVQASANDFTTGINKSVTGTIPITITGDPAVNNGATTAATLSVTATNSNSPYQGSVVLNSYTYDAVPEPSSLALLALGAGGVLVFRQRKKARSLKGN